MISPQSHNVHMFQRNPPGNVIVVTAVSLHYLSFHSPIRSLLGQLKICQMTAMEEQVKEFSAKLALVPVPPPGQLHVVGSF